MAITRAPYAAGDLGRERCPEPSIRLVGFPPFRLAAEDRRFSAVIGLMCLSVDKLPPCFVERGKGGAWYQIPQPGSRLRCGGCGLCGDPARDG
jgi:hypothetical protein